MPKVSWWTILDKRSSKLCKKDGSAKNPNPEIWFAPEEILSVLKKYHPGAPEPIYEMRSKPRGGHSNQCTYD